MKIHEVEQGSSAWQALRCGIPTASEFDALLTPEFKPRTGQTPESYLLKKLAESVMGYQENTFTSHAMNQGVVIESEVTGWLEFAHGIKPQRVGFCTTDDGRIGCSPDALIGDDDGLEVKCPEPHTHLKYLLGGTVPKEYAAQVHGCMFVTGRPRWTFVSYSRYFPALIVRVERDRAIQDAIGTTLRAFVARFDAESAKLTALISTGGRAD